MDKLTLDDIYDRIREGQISSQEFKEWLWSHGIDDFNCGEV
jgi:hypothetical protein